MLTFTDVSSPGDKAEFETWYEDVHIPQVLEHVPGITGANRYLLAPESAAEAPGGRRYLAVYRIEADDPQAVVAALQERIADGTIGLTGTLQTDPPPLALLYLPASAEK